MDADEQIEILDACGKELAEVLTKYNIHGVVYMGHIHDHLPDNKFNLQSSAISTLKPRTYGQHNALIDKVQEHVSQLLAAHQQSVTAAEQREAMPN